MATPSSPLESRIQDLLPEREGVYTDIHAHPENDAGEELVVAAIRSWLSSHRP